MALEPSPAPLKSVRIVLVKQEDGSLLTDDQKLLTKEAPGRAAGEIAPNQQRMRGKRALC
jgi:hypothetical protein